MGGKIDAVLLASGGLDSTTLAYWLLDKEIQFHTVFIDYGQHCASTELNALREVLPLACGGRVTVLDVSDVYRASSSRMIVEADLWKESVVADDLYLPYRNLLFMTLGSAYAQSRGCSKLYAAFINSNHAKEIDCSAEFFDKLSIILADYGTVRVEMPFRNMSKYEVAKLGIALKAPIGQTFSCQVSSSVPCGACPNCVDRLDALERLAQEERGVHAQ